jgi:hypothetical protein
MQPIEEAAPFLAPWLVYTILAVIAAAVVVLIVLLRKNRSFMPGDVFHASRWTAGNRLFPTQVGITPTSVVQYRPRWFGRQEESIHIAHVSSVKIETGMMFSNVRIETSGGSDPILCHGHTRGDAEKMKELIEHYQTELYKK